MLINFFFFFLARLDEVQEELLYYPRRWRRCWLCQRGGVSKKFNVKVFFVMGKALSGKLSCPCDRSCFFFLNDINKRDRRAAVSENLKYFLYNL